jgi:hypothetical protein
MFHQTPATIIQAQPRDATALVQPSALPEELETQSQRADALIIPTTVPTSVGLTGEQLSSMPTQFNEINLK